MKVNARQCLLRRSRRRSKATATERGYEGRAGLSLTEIAVIIATIALLVGLSVPAVRAFIKSFETGSSTKSMISAALFNARAIAAKEQRYAGVRFQKDLAGNQYVIFIVHEEPRKMGNLGNGFRAVEGLKPIKLPETVGVIDFSHIQEKIAADPSWELSNDPAELTNLTTFSILFSPSGKLVIHEVRVRNKNGYPDTTLNTLLSNDDVFNKKAQVDAGIGMFYQDDYFGDTSSSYPDLGLGPEPSRNSFIIYEQKEFKRAYESGQAWSGYLSGLEQFYINAYMGTIIE